MKSFSKLLSSKKEDSILERLETYTGSPDVEQYLWENWYQLKESIDTFLMEKGIVHASDLAEILPVHRLAALDRYISRRPDGDFTYHRQKEEIILRPFSRVKKFLTLWNKVLKRWEKSIYGTERHAKDLDKLIELLATALGFTVTGTKTRYLDIFGYVIDTSTLHLGSLEQLSLLVLNRQDRLDEVISEIQDVVRHLGTARLFSLIIALGNADKLRMQLIHSPFVGENLVLSKENLLKILTSKNPIQVLRSFIIEQVNLLTISPFVTVGPTLDRMFFGREKEIQELIGRVRLLPYVVTSGRRVGKTSMLGHLHRVRLPAAGFRTLYHDCSTTPTCAAFLAANIHNWRPEPPPTAPATFNDLLQSPPDDKSTVLLLDEADKLIPADRTNGWSLFNILRTLANSDRIQIILSGERTLRDALRDSKSPLFNFVNEMLLGPLDYRAVEELVTRPMKQLEIDLVDEKAIVDRIWAFTSGHPNVVQCLCHRLIKQLNDLGTRCITLDDVNTVIEDPGFQRDDFLSTYWEAATPLEKIVSLLMADDEGVHTLRTVRQALAERCNLHPKAREVDDALQRLVDLRSILKRTPTGYKFAVEAFPRVVAGTMTLDDMLEVWVEGYAKKQAEGET